MRQFFRGLTLLFGVVAFLGFSGSVLAAPPPAAYGFSLTDDGSCHFSATATWSHTKVTEVDYAWTFGFAAWQDTLPTRGHSSVDHFDTAGPTDTVRTWSVTATFYSGTALLATMSDDDMVACAILL
jgi:hypothetical protein